MPCASPLLTKVVGIAACRPYSAFILLSGESKTTMEANDVLSLEIWTLSSNLSQLTGTQNTTFGLIDQSVHSQLQPWQLLWKAGISEFKLAGSRILMILADPKLIRSRCNQPTALTTTLARWTYILLCKDRVVTSSMDSKTQDALQSIRALSKEEVRIKFNLSNSDNGVLLIE